MSGGSTAIILAHHALTFNFRSPSASSPNTYPWDSHGIVNILFHLNLLSKQTSNNQKL